MHATTVRGLHGGEQCRPKPLYSNQNSQLAHYNSFMYKPHSSMPCIHLLIGRMYAPNVGCNMQMLKITTSMWATAGPEVLLRTTGNTTTGFWLVPPATAEALIYPNAWHHIVLSANLSACALSVDGQEAGFWPCNVMQLIPGIHSRSGMTVMLGGFDGWLDEFRMSSTTRGTQAPNAQTPPAQPPPVVPTLLPALPSCLPPLVDSSTLLLKV